MPKRKETMQGPVPTDKHFREEDLPTHDFDYGNNPSWRIFRIMAEFVDGFNFLSKYKKTVTFFGSARFAPSNKHYKEAQELARMLARAGYTIISGGGPGIMEAANKGAVEGKGKSVGINIQLPSEQRTNPYVRESRAFYYFFTRKVMLAFSAEAYIFFPGGYGTLDEVFELMTLRQTHKINPKIPIILVGRDYWSPLCDWITNNLLKKHKTIDSADLKLWDLVDTPEEAFKLIKKSKVK